MIDASSFAKSSTLKRLGGLTLACMMMCAAPLVAGIANDQCLVDATGFSGCTANDIGVNQINVILLKDGCVSLSDTAIVNIELVVNAAQPTRYDVGLFLAQDGSNAIDTGGVCFREALFPTAPLDDTASVNPLSGYGPFLNRDGDLCGDAEGGASYNRTLSLDDVFPGTSSPASVTIACTDSIDAAGNAIPNGYVDMGWVASWDQNAATVCNSVLQAVPGTSSKCQAGRTDSSNSLGIPIGIPNLGISLVCGETCIDPGESVSCTLTYTNDGVGPGDNIEFRIGFPGSLGTISDSSFVMSGTDSASVVPGVNPDDSYISLIPNGPGLDDDGNPCAPCSENIPPLPAGGKDFSFEFTLTDPDVQNFMITATTWFNRPPYETQQTTGDPNNDPFSDSQLICTTPAVVSGFSTHRHHDQILVEWRTDVEDRTAGFHLERLDPVGRQYVRLNDGLLPAIVTSPAGGTYAFLDEQASHFGTPTYRLIAVDRTGATQVHGPYQPEISGLPEIWDFDRIEANGFARRAHGTEPAQIAEWNRQQAERIAEAQAGDAPGSATAAQGVKIRTVGNGLVAVNDAELAASLGVDAATVINAVNLGSLKLSHYGAPVRYLANADAGQLLFVAEAQNSRYTDAAAYIAALPQGPALRTNLMQEVPGFAPPATDPGQTFTSWAHVEHDAFLVPYAVKDPDAEIWFSGFVSTGFYGDTTYETVVPTPGAAGSGTAELRAELIGLTDMYEGDDHHVQVRLNDALIGEHVWNGLGSTTLTLDFDQSILQTGGNTLVINGVLGQNIEQSSFLVDGVDVGYERFFSAHEGSLRFTPGTNKVVTVDGFTGPDIDVFDVKNPDQPRRLVGLRTEQSGNGFRTSFYAYDGDAEYLVVQRSAASAPDDLVADYPSDLKMASNRADYLVIVPSSMARGGRNLVEYRKDRFPKARLVRLEDVYDDFNYGVEDPIAIRRFLEYAYENWDLAPKYVVLAGKGTLDPKDNLGFGTNVLPVLLANTPDGVFASDNRFADVVGNDGVPEFALGRIPALSSSALTAYVQKLAGYEATGPHPGSGWALMLADNADNAGNFPADSLAVSAYLPAWVTPQFVDHAPGVSPDMTRQQVLDGLSQGAAVFNYLGHGALMQLGAEAFWQVADLAGLNNGDRLPVFSAFSCYAGNGTYPGVNSLAEEMTMLPGGGVIAAFAPTGTSVNSESAPLNEAFVQAIFDDPTMGLAVSQAVESYATGGGYRFVRDIYQITGDPAISVQQ